MKKISRVAIASLCFWMSIASEILSQDLIVHAHQKLIERKSLSESEIHELKTYSILNQNASSESILQFNYNELVKIKKINVKVSYPSSQSKLTTYTLKDFKDLPAYSNTHLFTDNRVKYLKIEIARYPINIEYEIDYIDRGTASFDFWCPGAGYNVQLISSTLQIITTEKLDIQYKSESELFECKKSIENEKISYEFSLSDYNSDYREPLQPPSTALGPKIWIAPIDFEYTGYKGSFRSWFDHGNWCSQLTKGRDEIPVELKNVIHDIVNQTPHDQKEIASRLYKHLQSHTRYVSISTGISGWQPMRAADVYHSGYGDCKALSFLMHCMLREAGIYSCYAVIGVGNQRISYPDFPSLGQANHAMLCIPFGADTTWLECTSQTLLFGMINENSLNRYALLVIENGSHLVKTPIENKIPAHLKTSTQALIDESGRISNHMEKIWTGSASSHFANIILEDARSQQEAVLEMLPQNNLVLGEFNFTSDPSNQEIKLVVDYTLDKMINTKDPFTLLPWMHGPRYSTPFDKAERNSDIYFSQQITDYEKISFSLPTNYLWDNLPSDVHLNCTCGRYDLTFEKQENTLIVSRELVLMQGLYSVSHYPEIFQFFDQTTKAENSKIALRRVQ